MSGDVSDLPLFGGPLAGPPVAAPKTKRAKVKSTSLSDLSPAPSQSSGVVIPFPVCANVQIVERLADTFLRLRTQHGHRCRDLLLQQHFRPLADRLRRLGVPAKDIQAELECLEAAIAEAIEVREGQPSTGGHAA